MSGILRTLVLAACLLPGLTMAQNPNQSSQQMNENSLTTGTVISSSPNTITIRTDSGLYQLFVFDRGATRPGSIANGTRVRITSTAGDDLDYRVASNVTVVESTGPQQPGTSAEPAPAVPQAVRRIERDIERAVRKYQVGVRTGVGLDPELILAGVHAEFGPFFHPDVAIRPNVEFGFGEVTTLFALNLEAIYRLPLNSRTGRWSAYAGLGPGFNFLHQNFERKTGEDRIDFGEFDGSVGLNILGGIQYRSGMFIELKTSLYASPAPTLRIILGYDF